MWFVSIHLSIVRLLSSSSFRTLTNCYRIIATARIADKHSSFNHIHQVAPIFTLTVSNNGQLGPCKSTSHTGISISSVWYINTYIDWQTDHTTYNICINSLHVASVTAIRSNEWLGWVKLQDWALTDVSAGLDIALRLENVPLS